jgi:hypothetical protein
MFPVMRARDASLSFLRTPPAMCGDGGAGFRVRACDEVTAEAASPEAADKIRPLLCGAHHPSLT